MYTYRPMMDNAGGRRRLVLSASLFVVLLNLSLIPGSTESSTETYAPMTTDSVSIVCLQCLGTLTDCQRNNLTVSCTSDEQEKPFCVIEVRKNSTEGYAHVEMGCRNGEICITTMDQLFECIDGTSSDDVDCMACCDNMNSCNSLYRSTNTSTQQPADTTSDVTVEPSLPETADQTSASTADSPTSEPADKTSLNTSESSSPEPADTTSDGTVEPSLPETADQTSAATAGSPTSEPADKTSLNTSEPSSPEPADTTSDGTVEPSLPETADQTSASTADSPTSEPADKTSLNTSELSSPEPADTTSDGTVEPSLPETADQTTASTADSPTSEPADKTSLNTSEPSSPEPADTTSDVTVEPSLPETADQTSAATADSPTSEPADKTSLNTSELSSPEPADTTSDGTVEPSLPETADQTSASTADSPTSEPADKTSLNTSEPSSPEPADTTSDVTVEPSLPETADQTSAATADSPTSEPADKTSLNTSEPSTLAPYSPTSLSSPEPSATTAVENQTPSITYDPSPADTAGQTSTTTSELSSDSSPGTESSSSTASLSIGACLKCNGTFFECQTNSNNLPIDPCASNEQGEPFCYINVTRRDSVEGGKQVEMGCANGPACGRTLAQLFDCLDANSEEFCSACCRNENMCNSLYRPTSSTAQQTLESQSSSDSVGNLTSSATTKQPSSPDPSDLTSTVIFSSSTQEPSEQTSTPTSALSTPEQSSSAEVQTSTITTKPSTPEQSSTTTTAEDQTSTTTTEPSTPEQSSSAEDQTSTITTEPSTPEQSSTTTTAEDQTSTITTEPSTPEQSSTTTTAEDQTSTTTTEPSTPEQSSSAEDQTSIITTEPSTPEQSSTTTTAEDQTSTTTTEPSTPEQSSTVEDQTSTITTEPSTPKQSSTVEDQTPSITTEPSTPMSPTALTTAEDKSSSVASVETFSTELSSTTATLIPSETRTVTASDTTSSPSSESATQFLSTGISQSSSATFTVPFSTAATLPSSSLTSPLLSTTRATNPPRTESLTCLICNGEPKKYCLNFEFAKKCDNIDDVCFVTYNVTGGTNETMSKGCKPREVCQSLQSTNDEKCQYGEVTDTCTWCCEDADECNRGINYLPTTAVSAAPTTSSSPVCDLVGYNACLLEFQQLVLKAATNPDILFNEFCGSVPAVFRCLATKLSDCSCLSSDFASLNQTLEDVLFNMTSSCPASCDPSTGFNCSMTFYLRLIDNLVNGIDCIDIAGIDIESERCKARSTGSCDAKVRDVLNVTFSAIRIEWNSICRQVPPTVTPPDSTESSACDVGYAKQCIVDLGVEIVNYYNYGGDLGKLCRLLEIKESCYSEISSTCSDYTRRGLDAAWNSTRNLIELQCAAFVKPKCDTTRARSCILDLWRLVDEAKDFQAACNLLPVTVSCVAEQTAGCSLSDQQSLNRSLHIVISDIGNKCENTIEVFPNATELYLQECGNGSEISYQFTGQPSTLCSSEHPNCRVYVEIEIEIGDNKNYPRCRNNKVIAQAVLVASSTTNTTGSLCTREVTSSNWNVPQTVSIAAKMDFKYDGTQRRNLTVWMRKDDSSGITFERRSLKVYTMVIGDCDRSAVCSSINDPHVTTFDGWYYNNYQEGFFVLYRHTSMHSEVQIITQRCNSAASCNCGVGVRSGDTVFFVDRCRKKTLMEKLKCKSKYDCKNMMKASLFAHDRITRGTRIFSRNSGKEFKVWLPHGTVVKITVDGDFLNVWITASPADWKNTEGLCGHYDGVATNDLRLRNGTLSRGPDHGRGQQPLSFNINWRAQPSDIIYTGVSKNPYSPPSYCECQPNTTSSLDLITSTCDDNILIEACDFDSGGTEILIESTLNDSPPSKSPPKKPDRVRRATTDPTSDLDIETDFIPSKNDVIDRSIAEANCTAFFNKIESAKKCNEAGIVTSNSSLESCIDDIAFTGDYTWMKSALEALKESCVQELSRNSSIPSDITSSILADTCPNECTNPNGLCVNGSCICNNPFIGEDCSIALNSTIDFAEPLNDGLCDVRSSDCTRIQMLGLGFVPNITTCSIQIVELNGTRGETKEAPLEFISENEVHCSLGNATSAIVTLYNLMSLSQPTLFTAYDAVCYKCIGNSSHLSPVCERLPQSCIIGGICYGPGEAVSDPCFTCQPDKSNSTASRSDSEGCSQSQIGLIVGLAVGLSTFVIVATIITVAVIQYKRLCTASELVTDGCQRPTFTDIDSVYVAPPPYDVPRDRVNCLRISTSGYKLGVDNAYQLDEVTAADQPSSSAL